MAEGKVKVNFLGTQNVVSHHNVPDYSFIYDTSIIKDAKWNLGDRVVLPDGREFCYARSTGDNALFSAHGCAFTYTGLVSYTAFTTAAAVGDKEITIPAATHAALTEDELRGGYVIIFDGSTDLATCVRQIIGNDASAADVAFKVRLDAPVTNAIVVGTEAVEVYRNPYAALDVMSAGNVAVAGLPATYVSASQQYFWVQTKGICWVAPQSGVGGTYGQVGCFWRHDGSIDKADTALATTVPSGSSSQYAGSAIIGSQSGNGPLFNMQGQCFESLLGPVLLGLENGVGPLLTLTKEKRNEKV